MDCYCPKCGKPRYFIDGYLLCEEPHGRLEPYNGNLVYGHPVDWLGRARDGVAGIVTQNKISTMLAGVKEGLRLMREAEAKGDAE